MPNIPVLCYVDRHDRLAWFTTKNLADQWGDDWNDAPWEHNAGTPSGPHDDQSFALVRVVWWLPDSTLPGERECNSRWSVQDINAGATPWISREWGDPVYHIHAGTTLPDFLATVRDLGGAAAVLDPGYEDLPTSGQQQLLHDAARRLEMYVELIESELGPRNSSAYTRELIDQLLGHLPTEHVVSVGDEA